MHIVAPAEARERPLLVLNGPKVVRARRAVMPEWRETEILRTVHEQMRDVGVEMPHLRMNLPDECGISGSSRVEIVAEITHDLGVGIQHQHPLRPARVPEQ